MKVNEPKMITPAMERARDIWPDCDWWDAGDECLALRFGGGVNTTALSLLLLWLGRKIEHIFSDLGPGAEHPRTAAFIENYGQKVHSTGCPFSVIGPESTYRIPSKRMPLLDYIESRRLAPRVPGPRWCTVSWKIEPVAKYSRLKFYKSMLGISAEETGRVSDDASLCFPLVEADIDRDECHEIIEAFGVCNPGKSGCMFCPRVRRWQIFQLWQDGLVDFRLRVENIPWGGSCDDPKHGKVVPLRYGDPLTREMIADWERGENIPEPAYEDLADMPCACKW